MKHRRQDFVLGLVLILMLAVFLGTFLFVYPRFGAPVRTITVRFKHEEGMAPVKKGSPVNLGGAMQVGKVSDVRREIIHNSAPGLPPAQLVILVDADVDESLPLYRNCQITTDQPPVGGAGAVVILTIGTPEAGIVLDTIDGLPPQSFAAAIGGLSRRLLAPDGLVDKLTRMLDDRAEGSLANKLSESLSDINRITQSLALQLTPDEQRTLLSKLQLILANLVDMTASLKEQTETENASGMLAKVNASLDTLGAALLEVKSLLTETRAPLVSTLTHVESVSRALDEDIIGKLKRDFDRDDPASLLGKLHASMNNLNVMMANFAEVSESGRTFFVVNRPALDRMIENFKSVSDTLRVGMQEIVLAPWRLLQPPDTELKRLDVFEAARSFAEAATLLDDTTARLDSILKNAQADERIRASDAEIKAIRDSLAKAFERYRKAEDFLYEKMK